VPLERHWQRVQTPLGSTPRRELRALVVVTAVLVIAVAVVLFFTIFRGGSSEAGPGCIKLTAASSTGAVTLNACGSDAARWCRTVADRRDTFARQVKERCRSAGYP
jgi:hypothetical protein